MSQTLLSAQTEATDRQSQTMRQLGWACCAYLLVFGGAVLLWLPHAGAGLEPWMFVVCALPLLAGLALLWRDTSDARQYTLHLLTATLAVPIMLLFWAGSVEGEVESVLPEAPSLDAEQLFDGAASVQVAEMPDSGIALLRSGQFSDGSELRLTRFSSAGTAERYLALLAQAASAAPFTDGGRQGLRLLSDGVGSTLVVVEQHGSDLLELRARDLASGLARLATQHVPAPKDGMPARAEPTARWPFFTAIAAGHGLMFVALIAWGGSHSTRVPALRGARVATADQLRARLLSLARPLGPFDIAELQEDGSPALRVDAAPSRRRTHHITLYIDAGRNCVRVHEKLGVNGDAPRDAAEASLRGPGDGWFDPARPGAQKVWSSVRQTTMMVPSQLAAVPLQLQSSHAGLPADYAAALDGEGIVTALCALVTRSGWHWQPRLFGSRV